ncbi:hypothetical protein BD779DRAFT_1667115 [Infundibulicybe gibba]|nr:hypothetical protein BD779DRAFT_1667115 [Infundibulicybe gibba]
MKFPPDIDELRAPGPELIADACDKGAVNPSYTVLSGILSRTFPALQRFQLDYPVRWERFSADEAWRVSVLDEYQANIVAQFKSGDPGVVDYDGTSND